VKLINLNLVPSLRMRGATLPVSHTPSWHAEGQFYCFKVLPTGMSQFIEMSATIHIAEFI